MKPIFKLLRRPTPLMNATKELRDAELALLEAQTGAEWAQSVITYNEQRIKRLRKFLTQEEAK